MITKAAFRALIIGSVSCLLFGLLLGVATESLLPAELQLYLEQSSTQEGEREIAMMSLGIPLPFLDSSRPLAYSCSGHGPDPSRYS